MKEHHFLRDLIFVAFLISFVCAFAGWRLNNLGYKELLNQNNTTEEEDSYVDYYGIKVYLMEGEEVKEEYYDMLYLRDDNTFYISLNSYYENTPYAGTYSVEDNKITFHETARYSSDMCFYTDKLRDYTGVIGDGIITVNINGTNYEFAKGFGIRETKTNRKFYSANPVDNGYPEGFASKWKDCTKSN